LAKYKLRLSYLALFKGCIAVLVTVVSSVEVVVVVVPVVVPLPALLFSVQLDNTRNDDSKREDENSKTLNFINGNTVAR